MSARKTGSWTTEETKAVVESYTSGATVQDIAKDTGRSTRSVQGKLTSEKVYVPPVKVKAAKRDEGPTKGEILTAIANTGFDVEGFDAATKPALTRLLSLRESKVA